jgi:hypothetical protein
MNAVTTTEQINTLMLAKQKVLEQELACLALSTQAEMNALKIKLDAVKAELRTFANGSKKEIQVEGHGKINVSAPFGGSETPILVFDEERLNQSPDLRKKLIEKGIAKEDIKKVAATKAKVTIKPNI